MTNLSKEARASVSNAYDAFNRDPSPFTKNTVFTEAFVVMPALLDMADECEALRERERLLEARAEKAEAQCARLKADLDTAIAFLEMDEEADQPGTDLHAFVTVAKMESPND
jgi:hypothetical protein